MRLKELLHFFVGATALFISILAIFSGIQRKYSMC